MLEKLGPVVRAVAQDETSQLRNREFAADRILEQLREALVGAEGARRQRRQASRERRLDEGVAEGAPSACAARSTIRDETVTGGCHRTCPNGGLR